MCPLAGLLRGQMRGAIWSSNTSVIHSTKRDICTIVILCVHSVVFSIVIASYLVQYLNIFKAFMTYIVSFQSGIYQNSTFKCDI